jgi:hypothetical protein
MPLSHMLLAAGCCIAALFWLLRATVQTFLCLLLLIYPTPPLLAVLVLALGLLCFR